MRLSYVLIVIKARCDMKLFKEFIFSVAAGICIGIGGTAFLSIDEKIVGALFFTVGLFVIVTNGYNLFTGKVCYIFDNPPKYSALCALIWAGNFVGTFAVGSLIRLTRIAPSVVEKAESLCKTKLDDGILSVFILAVFCNMMIYIAVDGYKNIEHETGKYLALFLGVAGFILCSFEHCIANMFYFSTAGQWGYKTFLYLLIMTLGNVFGGVIFPLIKKINKKV